mmetsp:Transcript_1188/g.3917  ORF Transcript_1188/g.3917 Transcript_1188/m.3917 type:complete len:165 (+) Transcript_1188:353-847(+)
MTQQFVRPAIHQQLCSGTSHLLSVRVSFSTGSLRLSCRISCLRLEGDLSPHKAPCSRLLRPSGGGKTTDRVRPRVSPASALSARFVDTCFETDSYTVKVMIHLSYRKGQHEKCELCELAGFADSQVHGRAYWGIVLTIFSWYPCQSPSNPSDATVLRMASIVEL